MVHCKLCNEQDEGRLIMSSRLVNGRVETIDICFRCYWRERFEAEGDGKALREECERADNKTVSAGSLDSPGL